MAPHSSTLAWKIPWMEEPSMLQSMGSLGIGHDWATSLSLFTFMHWRRKWQPTPVFLPGESQRRRSLVGCCLWGRTELDTTEVTYQQCLGQCWKLFPRLVLTCVCLISCDTCFLPCPWGNLQVVDFWDLQILQCGSTSSFVCSLFLLGKRK